MSPLSLRSSGKQVTEKKSALGSVLHACLGGAVVFIVAAALRWLIEAQIIDQDILPIHHDSGSIGMSVAAVVTFFFLLGWQMKNASDRKTIDTLNHQTRTDLQGFELEAFLHEKKVPELPAKVKAFSGKIVNHLEVASFGITGERPRRK